MLVHPGRDPVGVSNSLVRLERSRGRLSLSLPAQLFQSLSFSDVLGTLPFLCPENAGSAVLTLNLDFQQTAD